MRVEDRACFEMKGCPLLKPCKSGHLSFFSKEESCPLLPLLGKDRRIMAKYNIQIGGIGNPGSDEPKKVVQKVIQCNIGDKPIVINRAEITEGTNSISSQEVVINGEKTLVAEGQGFTINADKMSGLSIGDAYAE
jgi:hypothetical protein